jgi:ATP-binding cassette subfamily C protein LapB
LRPLALPAIALKRDGGCVIVLERNRDKVLVTSGQDAGTWVKVAALMAALDGKGFFVQAKLFLDARSELYEPPNTRDWFWGPLRENASIYGYAALASFVTNLAALLSTFYVMAVYDRVIPNRSFDTLTLLTTGVIALYLLDIVLKSLRGYLIDSASRRFDVIVGSHVFAHLLALQPTGRPASAGTLANTVREFDSLRDFFTSATLTVLGDIPFLILFVGVIAYFAGPVAWVPLIAIPVALGLSALFLIPLGRITDQLFRESAQRSALLFEVVNGLDVLRAVGGQPWARRKWDRLLQQNAETNVKSRELAHLSLNATMLVQSLVTVGVVVVAALMVADAKLSTGAMVACSILAGRAIAPIAAVAGLIGRLHTTRASLAALDKLMQAPREDAFDEAPLHLAVVDGAVSFRGVGLVYPQEQATRPALDGVDLEIAPGEHVAIIGRVGSGKSSLLALVPNLFPPTTGHVLVDGVDVRQIASADLRAQVGFVPQDPVLFHGTVRENITLGAPGASDEAVVRAARVACLDDLLASTAAGLGMQVGEGGRRLSGGMRQAVTLARALVADPAVLLLDEPTSMMDQTTERKLLARLAEVRRGKTTVLVTHRPAVLALVQRVVVVEGGRVVADGPKDAVLAALRGEDGAGNAVAKA